MKTFLNTLLLLTGLFLLSRIGVNSQTAPTPATCLWASVAGASSPNMQCVDAGTVVKSVTPTGATGAPGVTGGPCNPPGLTPPAIAIYAQDPATKACFPIITIADSGFQASLSTPGTFLYAVSQPAGYSVPSFPKAAYGDWQAGTYTLHKSGAVFNVFPPPSVPQPQVAQ